MAEPARRLGRDKQPGQVYDDPGTAVSDPKPDLKSLEESSEAAKPGQDRLEEAGLDEPAADDLAAAEQGPEDSFYTKNPSSVKRTGFWRGPLAGRGWRRKRVALTAAVLAAAAAASIFIFLSLLPLKILHIVSNLQDRFYATSQSALENETDTLFKRYVRYHVLPSYKSCGTTIDKNCSVKNVVGSNPISNLYRSWANNRLENKLATNYGIEFQKKPDGWYIKTPSTSTDGLNIGQDGGKLDSVFQKAGVGDIHQALRDETRWYQVYFRFKVGRLLEEKYGVKRCIIFCGVKDSLADKVAEQKIAAKLYLTQRVIVPRTQTLGIVLECLFTNCAATETQPTDATSGVDGAEYGAPENKETDTAIRVGLTKLAASYGLTDAAAIDALINEYTAISEKGFQNYLLTKTFTPILGEGLSGKLADSIPIAGWIDMFSRLINSAHDSSKNLKKLSYLTNATAAVSLFAMYRTYADEIKTGNVNATEVGSLTDSLSPGDTGTAADPQVGGNVGAEGAPLYSSLIDRDASSSTAAPASALIDNLLNPKALAASADASTAYSYKCNDGNPIPAGQTVCPEEVLGVGSHYADLVTEFTNQPSVKPFLIIAELWKESVGLVFDKVYNLFSGVFSALIAGLNATCGVTGIIPGINIDPYCTAKDLANKYLPQLALAIAQWLIPNPFSTNMSGGRTFDMMAAGADVAGNDSAHTTLGGQQLNSAQAAAIVNEQQQAAKQEFNSKPFFARMFDTSDSYSLASRLAMALPLSWGSAAHSLASLLSNPFGGLSHSFSAIFSPSQALAATAGADPFGVTQYGYPAGTIPDDPETYWQQNCSDNAAYAFRKDNSWNEEATATLDANQMPTNGSVNPCLLIMAATGSDGAIYDSGLLTQDDLSGQ